ncbi:CBS domain-containing protein [Iamia majanohamensis]|uniref:CBS domain-containing protein n=1 Tax=Iamia majanohamensis TaxID=467976 RepID=A0AAE9YC83_9ACTN|nr:CBS domain-containing protein [Iamia majanohamensis]WCO65186.1 CBS domain-containing protein [Iamia majanohamensis]
MHVEGLLSSKGAGVVTVASASTVAEVVATLAEHRVGALVVSDDGARVDGIVSERDIVRALAERGSDLLGEGVATIMTSEVVTCDLATTVDELSSSMTERRIRHVPVVVDGRLAGIVSIGDVVKDRMRELEAEAQTLHEYISHGR